MLFTAFLVAGAGGSTATTGLTEFRDLSTSKGVDTMKSKKTLVFFLFQLPICLLVGILLSFAYSMQAHDEPSINWVIALLLALAMDVLFTWRSSREEKKHDGAA
jgi:hypothetical protein